MDFLLGLPPASRNANTEEQTQV